MKDLMKKIWKPGLALMVLSAPVLFACDDDDDNDGGLRNDPNIIQAAQTRYPGAQIREVERTPGGFEIQLWMNNGEVDMHVNAGYQWLYTEYEDIPWASVPEAVTTAFSADGFTFNPREDDVDRIEFPEGNTTGMYYRIELDREPQDIVLRYNPDGTQYQPTQGQYPDYGDIYPGGNTQTGTTQQAITEAVNARYPDARITEIDRTAQGYEAELIINRMEADMHFDAELQWLFTEFEDMPYASLPEAVVTAFTSEGYTFNAYEDDVDRIEYPEGNATGEYYRIELDREPRDIVLLYNPDGSKRN